MGLWVFSSSRKHLLATLLVLEFMVLGIFIIFYCYIGYSSIFYSLLYLVFTACEGALGLVILVNISRSHGRAFVSSFRLNY